MIRYHSDRDGRYTYGRIEVSGEQVRLDFSGVPVDTTRAICRLLHKIK